MAYECPENQDASQRSIVVSPGEEGGPKVQEVENVPKA